MARIHLEKSLIDLRPNGRVGDLKLSCIPEVKMEKHQFANDSKSGPIWHSS